MNGAVTKSFTSLFWLPILQD